MVSSIDKCNNCDHVCHCGKDGVCEYCRCDNCEHNPLDEFYKSLIQLNKHKD